MYGEKKKYVFDKKTSLFNEKKVKFRLSLFVGLGNNSRKGRGGLGFQVELKIVTF